MKRHLISPWKLPLIAALLVGVASAGQVRDEGHGRIQVRGTGVARTLLPPQSGAQGPYTFERYPYGVAAPAGRPGIVRRLSQRISLRRLPSAQGLASDAWCGVTGVLWHTMEYMGDMPRMSPR